MPYFGETSRKKLDTCHRDLRLVCERVIRNYDFTILEGHRSNERQDDLFHQGKSKLKAGQSKHNANPSLAVDIAPYKVDWENLKRFYFLAGMMFQAASDLNIKIRWGGDFNQNWDFDDQSFLDLPHFELVD